MIKTTINGTAYEFDETQHETAVETIRQQCGLTGTKKVCGTGACGACTVLVDGVPMTSCVLPNTSLEARDVTTIEQYRGDKLHPMQQAFMVHDGLQCGFCTPGFIVESIAFFDQWRKEHGTQRPSKEQVAEALAGHLCRCGAYLGIYEAVQSACAGDFDEVQEVIPARVDALEKVTGEARYTVDIQLKGQRVGKILRSPHAHAHVKHLDLAPARAIEGVTAVIDLLDASRKVRFHGHEIAAVAAIDERTAQKALQAIQVAYEVLPAITSLEAARDPHHPAQVWPEKKKKQVPNAAEGLYFPGTWDKNLRNPKLPIASKAPKNARHLVERAANTAHPHLEMTLKNAAQSHTCLEPHCAVARWNKNKDHVTVYASTQACDHLAHSIAEHFHLPVEHVTVHSAYVGGGFGSKLTLKMETIAAVALAKESGAPVSVVLDRHEEMMVGGYRPAVLGELAMSTSPQGDLEALQVHAYADSGIAVNSMVGFLIGSSYNRPGNPRDILDIDTLTNTAPGSPFRGPGGPSAAWILEQGVDQLAHDLQVDPIALRRKWDHNPNSEPLYKWLESLPVWQERSTLPSEERYTRGLGLAMGFWGYFYDPKAEIRLQASAEGFTIRTASQDMGNGTRTVLAKAVAEVFQLQPHEVHVILGDSREVHGPTSGGSRTTSSIWAPAYQAAQQIKAQILQDAKRKRKLNLHALTYIEGGVRDHHNSYTWLELMGQLNERYEAHTRRGYDRAITERIAYTVTQKLGLDIVIGQGNAAAACLAEVEVDKLLGKIRIPRVWMGFNIGRVFVPALAASQIYGGVIQGIGYALHEEKRLDPTTGRLLTTGLEDYRIPGIAEMPEIDIYYAPDGFPHAPGQGVGLAEVCTMPIAASIANAVFHATGWRPLESPIRPERLVKGVQNA
ncbi:MAG: molybdopterin-dependent oxidoreductase [Myxococcales bacterium]|nr:molybdopterin-dependent oxidoreductase [Myxococcales bacterium]MCB9643975.1 molybdopterin-dependent oxidoreductase [Myxococcales bacterium]